MSKLPPQIARIANRYRTQGGAIRQNAFEAHTLASLSQRLLLSPQEALEVVSRGDLISLSNANGKFVFSSRAMDLLRDRVIAFISTSITEELSARGFGEDRICFALERAFQKQHELSRGRGENVVEFARTPQDDDDDDFYCNAKRTAGQIAGAAAAGGAGYLGYKAYQALKNRGNNGTAALPGPGSGDDGTGPQSPQSGGGGPRTPRDPNSSATGIDTDINGRHPVPPVGGSLPAKITTQSPRTLGGSVIDPLSQAVAAGKRTIARRGSAIWAALKNLPIE